MLQPKFLLSRAKPRSIQITSKTTQKYQLQIEKKSLLFVFYTFVFFHTDCSHLYAFSIHILFYHFLFYYFFSLYCYTHLQTKRYTIQWRIHQRYVSISMSSVCCCSWCFHVFFIAFIPFVYRKKNIHSINYS